MDPFNKKALDSRSSLTGGLLVPLSPVMIHEVPPPSTQRHVERHLILSPSHAPTVLAKHFEEPSTS